MFNREIGKHTLIPKQSVAFLGPVGTYSYITAREIFESRPTGVKVNKEVEYVSMPSIFDVFEKVRKGEVDFGVVPVENSIEGAVKDSMNLFLTQSVVVLKQYVLNIDHCLLSTTTSISDIKIVKAHPQALGQCKIWLSQNLPNAVLVPALSNVSNIEHPNEAIIASKQVAPLRNLNILAENISDIKENKTLFYLITKNSSQLFKKETIVHDMNQYIEEQGGATVLFLLEALDKVGILRDILSVFADQSLSMTRIHSLPTGELGRYYFIIDVKIDKNVEVLEKVYSDLEKLCSSVFVLGAI